MSIYSPFCLRSQVGNAARRDRCREYKLPSGPILRCGSAAGTAVIALALLLTLSVVPRAAFAAVGNLRIIRQVLVTKGPVAPGQPGDYVPAHDRQEIDTGQGVRTLKRAQAEIDFQDGSVLRVNERTDLVVEDTAALRNIHLAGGAVWVRVAKGVHTQVETPSATAVARGTVFSVAYLPDGSTVLTVLEGVVDITATGGATVSVSPGQKITIASNGATPPTYTIPAAPTDLSLTEMPTEYGGGSTPWWATLTDNLGLVVTAGTDAILDLRDSPVGEALQELAQGGPNVNPNPFFFDPAQQREFFQAAQSTLVNTVIPSGATQSSTASLASAGFNTSQISTLQSLGITTVGQALQALSANAANLNITIPTGRGVTASTAAATTQRQRSEYPFQQLTGGAQPDYDYRLLDQNETSLSFVGIGAALALFADTGHFSATVPTLSAQAFGFANDPSLFGGRANLSGEIAGKTHYELEGNVIRILSGGDTGTYSKPDSVAVVEQSVTDKFTVFAGRRRFYEGPVFQDEVSSQLIADRFTGAGVTYKAEGVKFDGAYLYDSNPDADGAQHGALGSITAKVGGGTAGLNYLRVDKLSDGNGITANLTYPVLPGRLELYGEAGRGPDSKSLQSYGGYFPGIYQATDIDLFVEYGYHEGIGHALSFIGNRDIGKAFAVRAYVSFHGDGADATRGGVAGIFKFSTR